MHINVYWIGARLAGAGMYGETHLAIVLIFMITQKPRD